MESGGSLSWSQEPATGPYPENNIATKFKGKIVGVHKHQTINSHKESGGSAR
jgi:hypothetical protein